jgi:GDP-L-fucose synthase
MKLDKLVLTGASGFLGHHTLPVLQERYGHKSVVGLSSKDYDLMDPAQVERMFKDHEPQVVVHLAGYSGGIKANRQYPADFFYRNILMTALMFEAAARHKIKKLVYPMGGCSYPGKASSPIKEEEMWNGYPQKDSAAYSIAKKTGITAAEAYRAQHGLDATVIIPGNIYGEHDNFDPVQSHVIPGMIRRYLDAVRSGAKEVAMWGSGKPTRDFVYAGDVAKLIPYFIESYSQSGPINLSTGRRTTIKELAETIAKHTGYAGKISWDASQPDGQMDKIFSPEKLNALGLSCPTLLNDGLKKTIDWFKEHGR